MAKSLYASILPQPEPGSVEEDAQTSTIAADVLATWRSLVPSHPDDGNGDKEDFWEMAYRLHAAVHSGGEPVHISIANGASTIVNPETLSWGARAISAEEAYSRASSNPAQNALYGPLSRFSPGNAVPLPQERMATLYASLAPYRAHSGRRINLVSVGEGWEGENPGVTVRQKLREYRAAGLTRAAIKSVASKRFPLTVFDIADGENPLPPHVEHSIGDWAMQLLGLAEAFILQGYVDVQYEYRTFIVGGRPVTGAANIEEFTPLDSRGDAFDTRMRQHRASRSEVVEEPERRERYIAFASQVAGEMTELGLVDYVLDVATDGDTDEPFIVELNGLLNSGLFASNPQLVTEGLVR